MKHCVYFCSRYPWESIWACIGLFLLISSVFIYVCVKKLTICCWTSLYPWLHPCCCRCCFFLRLLAPRCRSLLGLVLLNPPHPFPAPSLFPVFCCSHHLTAATKAWSRLPSDGCFGCTTNSQAFSPLLSLHNFQICALWVDIEYDNGICLVQKKAKIYVGTEGDRRRKHIRTVWSTVCHLQPPSPVNHPAATC